jgi:hypothetical protein
VDPKTASLGDVIRALNGFYSTYLERCIRENEEFAQGAETDCYRENCQSNDKVFIIGSIHLHDLLNSYFVGNTDRVSRRSLSKLAG